MPLEVNISNHTRRIGLPEQVLENLRKFSKEGSWSRVNLESVAVNSQIREQVLSNQGAARRILDREGAELGLGLVKKRMAMEPSLAASVQASGGKLIEITHKLLS